MTRMTAETEPMQFLPEPKVLPQSHRMLAGRVALAHARRHNLCLRVESAGGWLSWDDVERGMQSGTIVENELSLRASVKYRGHWAHFNHARSPGIYQGGKQVCPLFYEDSPRAAQMWIEGRIEAAARINAAARDSRHFLAPSPTMFLHRSGSLS